jgi:hypothetical protein
MLIVIQDKLTLKFLTRDGQWVSSVNDANNFETTSQAQAHCRQKTPKNGQIMVFFKDKKMPPIRIGCESDTFSGNSQTFLG